ncbi:unnamed protein product [Aphanomyces euteiches]|uniref:CBM1 domain-containing protein n=1 Tax=Aphanomyces euteiches TaxID=100861 RepID=A0A6G0WER7_9STRA|nr:hypothetical protein Ae201684_016068 [Aphanomyces euteiches]KAH9078553.1 hypothetical protein Ae201684P_019635 [Aphanomyces euteiches]KAH9151967.1 hypothetical protein AeRB84_005542 [Aphanomyces euteiches]
MKTIYLSLALAVVAAKELNVCSNNSECDQGYYCKPTGDDKKTSTCQPNGSCAKKWSQCGGSSFVGSSCCEDGSACKKWNSWYSQCVPKEWIRDAEQSCINVSVEGDATYCSKGPICGGGGSNCPKRGEVAVADCVKTLTSYVGANAKCVAPEDASCKKLKTGAWGCVWSSKEPQKDAEQSCINVSVEGDATYCTKGPICGGNGSNCPKKGDVAVADCVKTLTSYVDAAKCVAPEDASCKKLKTGAWGCVWNSKGPQWDIEVAEWQQCGGKGYSGKTGCSAGYECKKWNDYYSQCIPQTHRRSHEEDIASDDTIEAPRVD